MPSELNGIVVVDKPTGISSAGVVARVKSLFGAAKVGHAGTLDPFATGVLVCCLNRATRLSRFLLQGDKSYEAEMVLGVETDTQDATGQVIARYALDGIDEERIRDAATRFEGVISQVPPIYSALKHRGTPLYKLARRGVAIEKPARPVTIRQLAILASRLPSVIMRVDCSSGTYIRSLCADLGRELGCGGHLGALRRTVSSGFTLDDAHELEELTRRREDGRLGQTVIPMHAALPSMPAVAVDDLLAEKIRHGTRLADTDFDGDAQIRAGSAFRVVDPHGRLVAVVERSEEPGGYNYCCVFST